MPTAPILTGGFGVFGDANLVPTLGFGIGAGSSGSGINPYWDILQATADVLATVDGCPTPQVREIPYVLGSDTTLPLCFVVPLAETGSKVSRQTFTRAAWWRYPVLVLLIYAGNRNVASGLEARLQLRHDVRQALFVPHLADTPTRVWDVEIDPQEAANIQAALGANYVVQGFKVNYQTFEIRNA